MSDTEDNIRSFHHFEDGSVVETTHIPRFIMSDTTIDSLLDLCITQKFIDSPDNTIVDLRLRLTTQAKSALYDLILKEVVGEDERLKILDTFRDHKVIRNKLRAEQRNKLKGLFDE